MNEMSRSDHSLSSSQKKYRARQLQRNFLSGNSLSFFPFLLAPNYDNVSPFEGTRPISPSEVLMSDICCENGPENDLIGCAVTRDISLTIFHRVMFELTSSTDCIGMIVCWFCRRTGKRFVLTTVYRCTSSKMGTTDLHDGGGAQHEVYLKMCDLLQYTYLEAGDFFRYQL
jgi:hypothetical protein